MNRLLPKLLVQFLDLIAFGRQLDVKTGLPLRRNRGNNRDRQQCNDGDAPRNSQGRVPPAPPPRLLHLPNRPSEDRLTVQKSPQVVGQFATRGIALRWLLL